MRKQNAIKTIETCIAKQERVNEEEKIRHAEAIAQMQQKNKKHLHTLEGEVLILET